MSVSRTRFYGIQPLVSMALLSAAALLLQVTLTRIFSIAQFYHFAFLVVSLALLGFGASGALLTVWPTLKQPHSRAWYAPGFSVTTLIAYLIVNHLAFDSYSIAWDNTQVGLLALNLIALAVPFAFVGALIGALLSSTAASAGAIYGANLIGSALGAISAPLVIAAVGSERVVLICALTGFVASMTASHRWHGVIGIAGLAITAFLLVNFPDQLALQPSPYKQLSHFRRNPDARIVATSENAYSRLDIVESATIHSAPGLSLTYFDALPPQHGLIIDGGNLSPVSNRQRVSDAMLQALPAAVVYAARPGSSAIVLGSAGGLDALVALANGVNQVTVIEPNRLIYSALTHDLREWAGLADDPDIVLEHQEIRSFVRNTTEVYDVVQLALRDNYQPITAGAFTLTEDYTLTVEAFAAYLQLLESDGLFIVSRWLQEPPSETLRTLGLIVEALDTDDPLQHLFVFRTFQLAMFVVKPTPFTSDEVNTLLERIDQLGFDLVLAPTMPERMINQYAVLATPVYHERFLELVSATDRAAFYATYEFDIRPPTDNYPFFYHFFRWEQTPDVIQNLGQRWQPFGGSGYFVLVALLGFAAMAASVFILVPVALRHSFRQALGNMGLPYAIRILGYFTALGLAFLMVEVVLIQKYILVLGQPTLAIATVIGALLFFSGVGSLLSPYVRGLYALLGLVLMLIVYPVFVDGMVPLLFRLPQSVQIMAVILLIAPLGLLMGMPFPQGISRLQEMPGVIPWAWAANGSASVISAVLAAMIALSAGFSTVLFVGATFYAVATLLTIPPRV